MRSEALPRGSVQDGGNCYPDLPKLDETFRLLADRYAFMASGASLTPMACWVERKEEMLLPTRGVRYVVEAHYVFPKLNMHVIHSRSRWRVDGKCEDVTYERVDFMPWAPSHVPVKYAVMGREVAEHGN